MALFMICDFIGDLSKINPFMKSDEAWECSAGRKSAECFPES